ncbi:MAG: 5'/3'-nucleotidase SurE [Deltaproteobacteria bacterium]|nr:5'/3'-nucleotidase SurE [Deltaproteobacteria bacterium]MBW2339319.1 5'/3'-nucleotidase SurE [Deltaproteobacteria bacterium]
MRILLTNDDGILAEGLIALYEELKGDFELSVVAPETEMSAVGHAITLSNPLRVRRFKRNGIFLGYGVSGTPADCVKIGVQEILQQKPDMILSGINLGSNVGINLLYSGTVSAATEGAFLGIPSVALSLGTKNDPDFGFPARFSRRMIKFVKENGLKEGTALNVNIPAIPEHKIKGISITTQDLVRHRDRYEKRNDPRGNSYYWLASETPVKESIRNTDLMAIKENLISITPITFDLTDLKEVKRLASLAFDL